MEEDYRQRQYVEVAEVQGAHEQGEPNGKQSEVQGGDGRRRSRKRIGHESYHRKYPSQARLT